MRNLAAKGKACIFKFFNIDHIFLTYDSISIILYANVPMMLRRRVPNVKEKLNFLVANEEVKITLSSCCLNTLRSILGKEGTSDLLALFYLKRGNQYCVVIKINVQKYFIWGCFYEHKSNTIIHCVNNTWITWWFNKSSFLWVKTRHLIVRNNEKAITHSLVNL